MPLKGVLILGEHYDDGPSGIFGNAIRGSGHWWASKRFPKMLIEKNIVGVNEEPFPPLVTVASYGSLNDFAEYLISKGADVNGRDKWGNTALSVASFTRNKYLVELLLSKGAEVTVRNQWGNTPLIEAARKCGNKEILEMLLAKGADVNAQNAEGETALMKSIKCPSISHQLIESGADIYLADNKGENVLFKVVDLDYCDSLDLFKYLIDKIDDLNQKNSSGKTLLHMSLIECRQRTDELLKHGADPTIKDNEGLSALDYCILGKLSYSENCTILKNYFPEEYSRIEREESEGEKP